MPITVVNRPGANGAISYNHTISKRGDPHTWQTSTDSALIAPLRGEANYNVADMTPLATVAVDDFYLATASNSRYNSLKDVIDAAKANPGQVIVGGVGAGSTDNLLTGMFEQKAGLQFSFVPFNGQGEMQSALLGGHVQLGWTNPGEALEHLRAGRIKLLGVASDRRLGFTPDVPTFKEQGVDMTFVFNRMILAPPGIPPETLQYYEDLFRRLTETESWRRDYIEKNSLTPKFAGSAETARELAQRNEDLRKLVADLGLLQQG